MEHCRKTNVNEHLLCVHDGKLKIGEYRKVWSEDVPGHEWHLLKPELIWGCDFSPAHCGAKAPPPGEKGR